MICAMATLDTGLFVYPSLSRSLLMECGLLGLTLTAFIHSLFHDTKLDIGKLHLFIIIWIVYLIIHGCLSPVMEVYRTVYLIVTLFSIIPLSYCLRTGLLTKMGIRIGLLLIAAAHIVYVLAQWFGLMNSGNTLYSLTGCCDNPTMAALYLAGSLPLYRFIGRRFLRWTFLGLALLCLVLLRCRTAYMGVCVEVMVLIWVNMRARAFILRHKWAVMSCLAVVVVVGSIKSYHMKRDSADGRILIWQLSAIMTAEHPMGQGYGLFAKHYNERQAEYFATNGGTDTERRNATFTYMAYNDYLEHGVDGGVIGAVFLGGFYALFIRRATRQSDNISVAMLSAFAIMSLTNFVCTTIQPWLMVMCIAAVILSKTDTSRPPRRNISLALILAQIALTSSLVIIVCHMTCSQMHLKHIVNKMNANEVVNDTEFTSMEDKIYSSEAFWKLRASNQMHCMEYQKAMQSIGHAIQLTAAPPLYYMMHQCSVAQGKEEYGIPYIRKVYYTCPSLLLPKLILMRYYDRLGNTIAATDYAKEIIHTNIKVNNENTLAIVNEAENYLDSNIEVK